MCVCGGGGQVKFLVVSKGGSLYLHLVRRGLIQNLNNVSKFEPPPLTL